MNIRVILEEKQAKKLFKLPNFEKFRIINEEVVLVQLRKTVIHWVSPLYIGAFILDLSKLVMQKFYYDVVLQHS